MQLLHIHIASVVVIMFFLCGCDENHKGRNDEPASSTQPRNSSQEEKESSVIRSPQKNKDSWQRWMLKVRKAHEQSRRDNKKMLSALQILVDKLKERGKKGMLGKLSSFTIEYDKNKNIHEFTLYPRPWWFHSTITFYVRENGEISDSGYW